MSGDILIIDDEADIRDMLSDIVVDHGYTAYTAKDSTQALQIFDEQSPSAVILDIWLQGSSLDGLGILEVIKSKNPHTPVIMISGHGNIETAVLSIKLGAYDYLEKPFKEDRLILLLKRATEASRLRMENEELKERGASYDTQLVGESSAVTQLTSLIGKVAHTSSRVLVTGPTGCGKHIVARLIHNQSQRKDASFVTLNAASLTDENAEKELCGLSSHSFSNVQKNRSLGIFEKAHRGTLFIDEIASLPMAAQGILLRLLQAGSFERSDKKGAVKADIRVIAATSHVIDDEIRAGRLREDLYYRINVVPIAVPLLKERVEDIRPLVNYFVTRCAKRMGLAVRKFTSDAIATMEMYSWPGDVRQLRNAVEWSLIMAPPKAHVPIDSSMLPPELLESHQAIQRPETNADIMGMNLRCARELFEKQYLAAQLERFGWNISKTAAFVGMERSAFHRKLKSLDITQQNTLAEKEVS